MDQETRSPEQNATAELGDWARSLVAKAGRAKAALSPWVQRSLEAGQADADAPGGIALQRQTAFTEPHTRAMVRHLDRMVGVESSSPYCQVWRPDVGSVAPQTFDRFAGDILQRHAPLADKYQLQRPEEGAKPDTELVLAPSGAAGSTPRSGPVPAESWTPPPMSEFFTPPVEPSSPPLPSRPSAAPAAQESSPSPRVNPATRIVQRRPAARPRSRVEELTPGGRLLPLAEPPGAGEAKTQGPAPEPSQTSDEESQRDEQALGPPDVLATPLLQRAVQAPPSPKPEMQPVEGLAPESLAPAPSRGEQPPAQARSAETAQPMVQREPEAKPLAPSMASLSAGHPVPSWPSTSPVGRPPAVDLVERPGPSVSAGGAAESPEPTAAAYSRSWAARGPTTSTPGRIERESSHPGINTDGRQACCSPGRTGVQARNACPASQVGASAGDPGADDSSTGEGDTFPVCPKPPVAGNCWRTRIATRRRTGCLRQAYPTSPAAENSCYPRIAVHRRTGF
jgi:hypothetical protein